MERLLTAYQEDLLSLDELRRRMPGLRQREQSLQGELQALRDRTAEEAVMLRLSETLASFLKRLRETAESLDIAGRQKILRLLVKEVLVDKDSITIRHSIPIPRHPDDLDKAEDATLDRSSPASPGYLLRSGSDLTPGGERRPRWHGTPLRVRGPRRQPRQGRDEEGDGQERCPDPVRRRLPRDRAVKGSPGTARASQHRGVPRREGACAEPG